ncbi:hypothetical protein TcCL_NonESM11723, partial [Trypanosoma cruzi]
MRVVLVSAGVAGLPFLIGLLCAYFCDFVCLPLRVICAAFVPGRDINGTERGVARRYFVDRKRCFPFHLHHFTCNDMRGSVVVVCGASLRAVSLFLPFFVLLLLWPCRTPFIGALLLLFFPPPCLCLRVCPYLRWHGAHGQERERDETRPTSLRDVLPGSVRRNAADAVQHAAPGRSTNGCRD